MKGTISEGPIYAYNHLWSTFCVWDSLGLCPDLLKACNDALLVNNVFP